MPALGHIFSSRVRRLKPRALALACATTILLAGLALAQPPPAPASTPAGLPLSAPSSSPATPSMPPGMMMPGTPTVPAAAANKGPDIHDLHGIAQLTFWERHGNEVIYAGIAAVILLAAILVVVLRKKPVPPLTPLERARQELAAARALIATGQDQDFAITVSGAVRHYLENAYHIPAPEQTTEEFLQETLRHDWLKGELTDLLHRFLGLCDLAKFAGQQFGLAEREQLLAAATEFVEAADRRLHPPSASNQKNPPADFDDDPASPKPTAADLAKNLAKVSSSPS